ncbi:MAG: hypothetical protein AAGF67_18305 [Verrucomicrobiota bacterium]
MEPGDQDRNEVENNPVIRFVEGKTFKVIAVILIVIGIFIALMTGGLRTSRVPSPAEQVKPWYER